MAQEPATKRVFAFFDGQNLFHTAKSAFGYKYPNYDPKKLAEAICGRYSDWELKKIFFYTGIHKENKNHYLHYFWTRKLAAMGSRGIKTFSRPLRYSPEINGISQSQEKGIDVRIAIDIVKYARLNEYDVAIIFSQDQDLSEAANEVKEISRSEDRWFKVSSAFPISNTSKNKRGINGTVWEKMVKVDYDNCLDVTDYRPQKK